MKSINERIISAQQEIINGYQIREKCLFSIIACLVAMNIVLWYK